MNRWSDMTDDHNDAKIYPHDSTRALLGLAFALIHEIKHHQGYDGERFAATLKAVASSLDPNTPGAQRLFSTFDKMIKSELYIEKNNETGNQS